MPGPKPKPTYLKVVEGTFRPDRSAPNQPDADGDIGGPPGRLNDAQAEVWRAVAAESPPGLLRAIDRQTFEGYVILLHARNKALEMWNATGNAILVRADDNRHVRTISNPYLKEVRRLTEQLRALEGEFGFTPAARSRISLNLADDPDDPASKYLT